MAQLTWHPATAWPLAHQAPPWSWSSAGLHPHADTPDRCMDRIFVTFINPTPRLRYATGRRPPAVIDFENVPEGVLNPQFNAFGECVKNSCSYVSITQRYKGYAKCAPAIEFARSSYVDLKKALVAKDTKTVDALLEVAGLAKDATPSPMCNGLRQMTLLANALFISEANPRSQTEALLARYYRERVLPRDAGHGRGDGAGGHGGRARRLQARRRRPKLVLHVHQPGHPTESGRAVCLCVGIQAGAWHRRQCVSIT